MKIYKKEVLGYAEQYLLPDIVVEAGIPLRRELFVVSRSFTDVERLSKVSKYHEGIMLIMKYE